MQFLWKCYDENTEVAENTKNQPKKSIVTDNDSDTDTVEKKQILFTENVEQEKFDYILVDDLIKQLPEGPKEA